MPEVRIFSISEADLIRIDIGASGSAVDLMWQVGLRRLLVGMVAQGKKGFADAVGDFFNGLVAVDICEAATMGAVVLDDSGRFFAESPHPLVKHGFGVVGALLQLGALEVANVVDGGWVGVHVVNAGADRARKSAGDALEKNVFSDRDADSDDREHVGDELTVEPLGLRKGSRKAVEDVAVLGVGLGEPGGDHLVDEVIGDELALAHEVFGKHSQGCVVATVLAQEIPRGDLGDSELGHEELSLRAFANAGCAEQKNGAGKEIARIG